MKVELFVACTILLVNRISSAAIDSQLTSQQEVISLEEIDEDLSKLNRADLEYLAEVARTKRSGDLISALKHKLTSGINSKLGLIAGASGHYSGGSSGYGHGHGHGYDYPDHSYEQHNHVDFWTLKKGILATLLQAAKAINGGLIAIKGQLIKGGGHLLSAKGKLISAKGEAITTLGRHIASTAKLYPNYAHAPDHHHVSAPVIYGHSGPGGYSHSSEYSSSVGVEPEYGTIPAGHSGEYAVPYKYNAALEGTGSPYSTSYSYDYNAPYYN